MTGFMTAKTIPRLFVATPLSADRTLALDHGQAHYLGTVLRRKPGQTVLVFNGADGEYLCRIDAIDRKKAELCCLQQTKPQADKPPLWLLFAPVKRARIDFIAEKATELGVGRLTPVVTELTQVSRVNMERLTANATEAAEQTGRTTIPEIDDATTLARILDAWPQNLPLIFCDEMLAGDKQGAMLERIGEAGLASHQGRIAILTGPEGGFSDTERARLALLPEALPVSLGPNILRADTAMLAALSIWQAHADAQQILQRTQPS